MTTIEYVKKQLTKHRRSLVHAMVKPNAGEEVEALSEKIHHYSVILMALKEVGE